MFPDHIEFAYTKAIPMEVGITRRDPSPVVYIDGVYHVWYTKNVAANVLPKSGFSGSIWHAISEDGVTWSEQSEAVGRGARGAFDECGVFTPTILCRDGMYYLYYTAMPAEWIDAPRTTRGAIGVACSTSPFGPWQKPLDAPVLRCGSQADDFDSLRVDDTCILVRNDRIWMYYKGRQKGMEWNTTKMGLALSDKPLGPWKKYEMNPVLDSGHEVCVWPHGEGVACLVCNVGPQGNTLQYAPDGISFTPVRNVIPPMAPGPFRKDQFRPGFGEGIDWGIAMKDDLEWPYLVRFDVNLTPGSNRTSR